MDSAGSEPLRYHESIVVLLSSKTAMRQHACKTEKRKNCLASGASDNATTIEVAPHARSSHVVSPHLSPYPVAP